MITYANDTIFEDECSDCKDDCSMCELARENNDPMFDMTDDREDLFETLSEIINPY